MSEYLLALVKVVSSYDKFVEVVDIYNGIYACLFAVINNLLNSFKVFLVYRICIVIFHHIAPEHRNTNCVEAFRLHTVYYFLRGNIRSPAGFIILRFVSADNGNPFIRYLFTIGRFVCFHCVAKTYAKPHFFSHFGCCDYLIA